MDAGYLLRIASRHPVALTEQRLTLANVSLSLGRTATRWPSRLPGSTWAAPRSPTPA